jgi:hypothetical protein
MRRTITILCLCALGLLGTATTAAADDGGPSLASFEGGTIDLRDGWGEAQACTSDGESTACFRTEAEMQEYLDGQGVAARLACTPSVRLYTGISYTGSSINLTTRGTFINLSVYGFDNQTSSYKIGGCDSVFYDGASGSGSVYPGNTSAGAQLASMVTGWNDRISSIYIY